MKRTTDMAVRKRGNKKGKQKGKRGNKRGSKGEKQSKMGQNWVKMDQKWINLGQEQTHPPQNTETQKHRNTISVPSPYLASKLPLEHIDVVVHERQHPLQDLPSIPRDSPTSTCSCSSIRFIPAKKNATSKCAGKAALWLSKTQSLRSSRFRSLHTDILAL